jgi:putative ABC transport system permease protein
VNLTTLALRNSWRHRLRSLLTLLGVAVSILTFLLLRTAASAWTNSVANMAEDRLATRNALSFLLPLPRHLVDDVRSVPGVEAATPMTWFAGVIPARGDRRLASLAIDLDSFFAVYPEIRVPEDQLRTLRANRHGTMIGSDLATQLRLEIGDRVLLHSPKYPGEWEFEVVAIYNSARKSEGQETFYLRADYLEANVGPEHKDRVGWISSRVARPSLIGQVAREIDRVHEQKGVLTATMSVRALNASLAGLASALMSALGVSSATILLIMILILGNVVAMSVRERRAEYGMLRVLGFRPRHIARLILLEAAALALIGGLLGVALAIPLIDLQVAALVREAMPGAFPYFAVTHSDVLQAIAVAPLLGCLSAAIPAFSVNRGSVVDSLRTTG